MSDTLKPPQQENIKGFPVFDYITPVVEAIGRGTPLPGEVEEMLPDYDVKFDLQEYVNEVGGKQFALARVNSALEIFNEFDLAGRIDTIVQRIKQIQPGQSLEPVPLMFVFLGDRGEGRSFKGTAIAVNMGGVAERLRGGGVSAEKVGDRIEAICVHEGIHVFTEQLGVGSQNTRVPLMRDLWAEGLTSYMVPELLKNPSMDTEELRFWMEALYEWTEVSNIEDRKELVRSLLNSNNEYLKSEVTNDLLRGLSRGVSPIRVFSDLMLRSNGALYRIAFEMWKNRIEDKEESLSHLVKQGPEQMKTWVKEYYEEKLD
jgi:hypothetical protein